MKIQQDPIKLQSTDIADLVAGKHVGENVRVEGVNAIDSAGAEEMTFWERETQNEIENSDAACIICPTEIAKIPDKTLIKTTSPRIDFLRVVNEFYRSPPENSFIHESATVAERAEIGDRCWIGPNVYIGDRVVVGDRCKIQSGTSIGGEGFAFAPDDSGKLWGQIHKGQVVIKDDVEIGSNCSIDRAIFDKTIIGRGTKIDNLVHIAHQTVVGEDVWIAYNAGLSGSVRIGDRTMIHPNAAVGMRVSVGEDVVIAMNAGVLDDTDSGVTLVGTPAEKVDR